MTSSTPVSSSALADNDQPASKLSTTGIVVRLVASAGVLVTLLVGTLYGNDDHFPFGPFRMYSTTKDPNGTVISTRMESVDVNGHRDMLRGGEVGLRRAEIEGQLRRLRKDPTLLRLVADAYIKRNPNATPLARIEIIVRHYELKNGKPSGDKVDNVVTAWDAPKVNR